MKAAFAILILWGLFSLAHSAENLLVKSIRPTGFEAMFDLVGTKNFDKVTLDCQSFIHGVSFYKNTHLIKHFYLEVEECSDLYGLLRDRSEQEVVSCLRLSETPRSVGITDDLEDCY